MTKGKIDNLERRLNDLAMANTEIKDLLASVLEKVTNMTDGMRMAVLKKNGQ